MADTGKSSNQRVTNAVLQRDIQHLTIGVDDMRTEIKAWRTDHEQRIRTLETAVAQNSTRLSMTTGLLGIFQLIGSAIAAALGMSR